jgi:hypothetical protein
MEYARYVNRVVRNFLTRPLPARAPIRRELAEVEPNPSYA